MAKSDSYINCSSCEDKYICPHAARGNYCGTKNGDTRPGFGRNVNDEAYKFGHLGKRGGQDGN